MAMKPKYSKQRRETCKEKREIDSNESDSWKRIEAQRRGLLNRRSYSRQHNPDHKQKGPGHSEDDNEENDRYMRYSVQWKHVNNSRANIHGSSGDKQLADGLTMESSKEEKVRRRNDSQFVENCELERNMPFGEDGEISKYREEIQKIKIPITSSTKAKDFPVTDIFRTLVRAKAENVSLKDVTTILSSELDIDIVYNDQEDFLSLFEQHEAKFDIELGAGESLISPKTDIAICSIYTNDTHEQHVCTDLHICKYFLLNKCTRKACKFGHNLYNRHNTNVLLQYGLEGLRKDCILTLIRNIGSRNLSTLPLICKFYNNEGKCKKGSKCMHLHVCKYFINDDCKFGKKCIRCHIIFDKQPMSVFEKYGIIPDSSNHRKIKKMIKGTLHDGGVLLKREVQSGSSTLRMPRQREDGSRKTLEYITSSEGSTTSSINDSSNSADDDFAEPELSELSDEGESTNFDVNLEDFDNESIQTADKIFGKQLPVTCATNIQRWNGDGRNVRRTADRQGHQTRRQDEIIAFMTFESQIENKIFRIRTMNGQLQIADMSDAWIDMEEEESEKLIKFHYDFIGFAEKMSSKAQS